MHDVFDYSDTNDIKNGTSALTENYPGSSTLGFEVTMACLLQYRKCDFLCPAAADVSKKPQRYICNSM
jgi:hypothetical protein